MFPLRQRGSCPCTLRVHRSRTVPLRRHTSQQHTLCSQMPHRCHWCPRICPHHRQCSRLHWDPQRYWPPSTALWHSPRCSSSPQTSPSCLAVAARVASASAMGHCLTTSTAAWQRPPWAAARARTKVSACSSTSHPLDAARRCRHPQGVRLAHIQGCARVWTAAFLSRGRG